MPDTSVLAVIAAVLLAWIGWFAWAYVRRRQRAALRREPLAPALLDILRKEVPLYRRMPEHLQAELRGLVNVFLADKAFIGCDGLVVTDEMRVVIAGNACVLLLNGRHDIFEGFSTVLVYPDTFMAHREHYDGEIVTEGYSANAGESWHAGPVILSWGDVCEDLAHTDGGHNVVLHEFAHKLDEQNDSVDGLPILGEPADYESWARVLTREYAELAERVDKRANKVLDSYGATSPPEFFAVATEVFFERGQAMRESLPELYEELRKFYRVDPAGWRQA